MRTLRHLSRGIAAALIVALSLLAVSCGKEDDPVSTIPTISFRANPADAAAGSQHLTVSATSSWTLSLSDGTWASLNKTSGTSDNGDVTLSYEENTEESSRSITITVKSGSKSNSYTFTQSGKSTTVVVVDHAGESSTKLGWMELPKTDDSDGLYFFSHSSENTKRSRNYSFYYNYDEKISLWVAYPLNTWDMSGTSRSNTWGSIDPLLPASQQQNTSNGYGSGNGPYDNGWYSRGHQIPSADRLDSSSSNMTTFYNTNMTPQNNTFNGGVWANLEGAVRGWARKSDTLYVVTGCVMDGAKYYVYDSSRNKIKVPVAYFKAVLSYRASSTIGPNSTHYRGCAFYFDHDEYSFNEDDSASEKAKATQAVSKSLSISIAELEEKLGYELFVNLKDQVGEDNAQAIKSQDPSTVSAWW